MAKEVRQVACPKCGRKQPYRSPDSIYMCGNCNMQFDAEGDDGGSFFTDPTKRIELEDEARIKRQNRTRARMGRR